MKDDLSIRISGEAGQGLKTIGITLTQIFDKAGLNIFANQDYMSRIRGGNNYFQVRISNKPLYTLRDKVDILVALDKMSIDIHKKNLNKEGIIIADLEKFKLDDDKKIFFNAPVYGLAQKHGGKDIYSNSVAVGILANITGIDFELVKDILKVSFQGKSEEIINTNINCLVSGYEYSENNFKDNKFKFKLNKDSIKKIIIDGNQAIGLGAIKAGCKFYSAYPMTPSTSIMDTIAYYSNDYNIIVEQAEDEIAAVNMVIGASFAGARAMTSTSGGGFALMQEGISLSGMTETPIVVVDAQRPAPATGFPTRTEQADLDFVIHAGHGEFAKVVFAPGTIEEAFNLLQDEIYTYSEYSNFSGKRYSIVPKEIRDYVKGLYGKPPAPIDEKIKRKIIGDEKPITCRPADLLEPMLDKIPDDVKPYIESDEDRITYVLFPQTALEFFKKRKDKRQEANPKIQPERLAELEEVAALSIAAVYYLRSLSHVKALTLSRAKTSSSNWVLAARQSQIEGGA